MYRSSHGSFGIGNLSSFPALARSFKSELMELPRADSGMYLKNPVGCMDGAEWSNTKGEEQRQRKPQDDGGDGDEDDDDNDKPGYQVPIM